MSFLNGLSGLSAGLSSFGKTAAETPPPEAAVVPPATAAAVPAAPAPETPPAVPAATPAPAAKAGTAIPAGVPAELLPIFEANAKRTGIPVAVLVAQAKQESGFRTDAVGKAGEIGLMQVKPSTASQPGFGMKGIDPATLKDPSVNIAFAADYLRARGGGMGADFSNPSTVSHALTMYNSGGVAGTGDPRYVQNVLSHIPGSS